MNKIKQAKKLLEKNLISKADYERIVKEAKQKVVSK